MEFWEQLPILPADELKTRIGELEKTRVQGVFAPQTFGTPFSLLSSVATVSDRLKLGAGIALAFVRSPLETACSALEVDKLSGGRLLLGLGSGARDHIEKRYGSHFGKPIGHMRELVTLVKAIIRDAHTGELGKFEGDYYQLDLTGFRILFEPARREIPIYLPGIFEQSCALAGEVAAGLLGHPLWTEHWTRQVVMPAVEKGLAKSGRERGQFCVTISPFVMINDNHDQAIEDARATVAFYSQTPAYNRYFDELGFGGNARAIQAASAKGDFQAMVASCPDAMVDEIVIIGRDSEVKKKLEARATIASCCNPKVAHVGLAPRKLDDYRRNIERLFYH